VVDNAVQEIDIATGSLLFQWSGLENLPVDETRMTYSSAGPNDLYHFNSIAVAPDGDLIISARNTWTVYKVSRATGAIVWRLGGKRSDFAVGPGAGFAWQHDARLVGRTHLSIFDNEAAPQEAPQSRAILLRLETSSKRASLVRQYTHPGGLLANFEGSMQVLRDGRVLVSWGLEPYFSEFSSEGEMLLDAAFPVIGNPPVATYTAYRVRDCDWRGMPADVPAAAVGPGAGGGAVIYASWNGATEVAWWTILAGPAPSSLVPAGMAQRTGFETSIQVDNTGPYFVAVAEDTHRRELGRSNPVVLGAS
jgi:hypothetical protein